MKAPRLLLLSIPFLPVFLAGYCILGTVYGKYGLVVSTLGIGID